VATGSDSGARNNFLKAFKHVSSVSVS
jgi:hypothetical protein